MKSFPCLKANSLQNRHNGVVLLFSILALLIILTPLQRYVILSRNQHWGLAIATLGIGYLLQTSLSWRKLSRLAQVCFLATGFFFTSVGVMFIENTWLDYKNGAITERELGARRDFLSAYSVLGLALSILWLRLIYQDMQSHSKEK